MLMAVFVSAAQPHGYFRSSWATRAPHELSRVKSKILFSSGRNQAIAIPQWSEVKVKRYSPILNTKAMIIYTL